MKSVGLALIIMITIPCSRTADYGEGRKPRVFFSDLDSGPNVGGQGNKGAFVTLWGKGFGPAREGSEITIGGGTADNYPVWADDKITFQLGPDARTGEIVVKVKASWGGVSNGVPFSVRSGRIFFVAKQGRDDHDGSYASPWGTITHAKNSLRPGDIAYLLDGVSQTSEDRFDAYLSMDRDGGDNSGSALLPKALVAYPGATVRIGAAGGLQFGVRTPNIDAREDYWVLSQLHVIGGIQAMDLSGKGWRIIGNDLQCPGADGRVGCFEMSESSQVRFYGNTVHNAGINPASSKFYHAVYFSTDSNHIDIGWNHIHDNYTCRAIQFHSSPLCRPDCGRQDTTGFNQYDLHVHDNLIHGDNCNGINFATIDPSRGPVEAYNNVIYRVGLRDPIERGGSFSCIYAAGFTNSGEAGKGTVEIFSNTVFDCGANNSRNAQGSRGAFNIAADEGLDMRVRNNIVYQLPGEIYVGGNMARIKGDNNLWFGAGEGPSRTSNNLAGDPAFVDRNAGDFHLGGRSPARDRGPVIVPNNSFVSPGHPKATDKDGWTRPQRTAVTLGAYEIPEMKIKDVKAGP